MVVGAGGENLTSWSYASRLFVSLYMRIITSHKLLQKLKVVLEKAEVVAGQICWKYFQSPLHNNLNMNISCIILTIYSKNKIVVLANHLVTVVA